MKAIKIIAILILLVGCNRKLIAQPAAGSYLTNNTMGAFHGTWQWTNGIDTVKVYLITMKVHYTINGGFDWDRLVGWHIYKRGNITVESSFSNINNASACTIDGSNVRWNNENTVSGIFSDITKHKDGDIKLTVSQNQMTWKLESPEGIMVKVPGAPPYQPGFTLPVNMILIKQ